MIIEISNNYLNNIIFFYILTLRITIFAWYNNYRDKIIYCNECYKNLGIFLPFTTLITFTSFGNYIFLYSILYESYKKINIPSYLFCSIWVVLILSNILYYVIVFPEKIKNLNQKYMSEPIILKILDHGPLLILFILKFLKKEKNNICFHKNNLIYPLYFGIFWLFFIWFPWYRITNDSVYNILSNKNSLKFRIKLIFIILLASIPTYFTGYLFEYILVNK